MLTWSDVATAGSVVTLLGAAADVLLLRGEKASLRNHVILWWQRLERSPVPDLPRVIASVLSLAISRLFRRRHITTGLLIGVAASFVLTTAAAVFGDWFQFGWRALDLRLPPYDAYGVNFVCDAATVAVSAWVFGRIARARAVKMFALIVFNLVAATVLATVCVSATSVIGEAMADRGWWPQRLDLKGDEVIAKWLIRQNARDADGGIFVDVKPELWRPGFVEAARYGWESARYWITGTGCCHAITLRGVGVTSDGSRERTVAHGAILPMRLKGVYYSMTTLGPIATFLALILLAILAKAVVVAVRAVVLRLLASATESDPRDDPKNFMPVTLCALVVTCVLVVWKLAETAREACNGWL